MLLLGICDQVRERAKASVMSVVVLTFESLHMCYIANLNTIFWNSFINAFNKNVLSAYDMQAGAWCKGIEK